MTGTAVVVFVHGHFMLDLFLPRPAGVLGSRAGRVAGVRLGILISHSCATYHAPPSNNRMERNGGCALQFGFRSVHGLSYSRRGSCGALGLLKFIL